MTQNLPPNADQLLRDLPDAEGAERFLRSFVAEHPAHARLFARDQGLLSDALALAAWSPFLAATLSQHPEHLQWLARERRDSRVRGAEELADSLARFAATNTALAPGALLARFRRRELLRIYLRDIRRTATLAETTEELSNLADAALSFALDLARQELDNLYGAPLCTDERGRAGTAGFCVVALGKLGSRELNYASDIDLLFLYSDDGATTGTGARGVTTNREYFIRLASRVAAIVGGTGGAAAGTDAAAYRVDLRLRPHGRDGVLAPSVAEAARYYRERAQAWERQVLIRARAAAGSAALFDEFSRQTRASVFQPGIDVSRALAHVRASKSKIDEQHEERGGINVKLGRGGIREIEFIAQALQLAYGGADEWLRAAHTLQSLARLADRRLLTDTEHAQLSDAYDFLRRAEHRAQMEHGLQTHAVPADDRRRLVLARRAGFDGDDALAEFDRTLDVHRSDVRRIYDRVFVTRADGDADAARGATDAPASAYAANLEPFGYTDAASRDPSLVTRDERDGGGDRRRSYALARVAASLAKAETPVELTAHRRNELATLCEASEYFGELIANHPRLAATLPAEPRRASEPDAVRAETEAFGALCREQLMRAAACDSFGESLACLRLAWAELLVRIGADDAAERIDFREANRRQTLLAAASIDAACAVARRELALRHNAGRPLAAEPRLAALGLGRLGGGGMDYGSDLDLVLVFDEDRPSPLPDRTHEAAYGFFAELLVAALSSLTRDGSLYRVDLRLRPDGANGRLAINRSAFAAYLRDRAAAWELLAYVKLHPSAGDRGFGAQALEAAHEAMRLRAARLGADALRAETRRVRERLERERGRPRGRDARRIDIKRDAGGMLDVYFAARYLQLRDDVREDAEENRTTTATLRRLLDAGSLAAEDWQPLTDGYALLRRLDHAVRLAAGRGTLLPPADAPALARLARRTGHTSPAALLADLRERMTLIRAAFDRVTN